MDDLAFKKQVRLDYHEDGILLMTTFDEMSSLDTSSLDSYLILACDNGEMSVDVNGRSEQLNTYEALILPPRTHLSHFKASADVRCDLCSIPVKIVGELLQHHLEDWDYCIYLYKRNHIITTEDTFRHYIDILSFKLSHQGHRYHQEVIQATLQSILYEYLELMMEGNPTPEDGTAEGRHMVLCKHFLKLLISRSVKHQSVDAYAQELCVTSSYLIKVCKKVTGKTAHQWIQEYTEEDIRYYLQNTDMSIKEICNKLGFQSLSFFGRYCSRSFGCSPTVYRKKMKKE